MNIIDLCRTNDLSLEAAEKALESLASKGLVVGFEKGNPLAEIILTEAGAAFFGTGMKPVGQN